MNATTPVMCEPALIVSVRANDADRAAALLKQGADVDARDEQGWTALCWAAGAGHVQLVQLLLEHGADVFATGRDRRTPYLIALAACRKDAARLLQAAEARVGGASVEHSSGQASHRPYCRGYELRELRKCPAWTDMESRSRPASLDTLTDDAIVFIHRDYCVTRSIFAGEDVLFDSATDAWRTFCAEQLDFRPPSDFDWLPDD